MTNFSKHFSSLAYRTPSWFKEQGRKKIIKRKQMFEKIIDNWKKQQAAKKHD